MTVGILGDISKLNAGLNRASASVGKWADKVAQHGKRVSDIGKKMSLGLTLPLVGFGVAAIKFASDAEEIQSKFDTVFKETAGATTEWINEFASTVGRSRTTLKEFASTFQDTFVPLGFAREEAAELSTQLVKLTVDLASFNNMAEPEVMMALQSAIVGNHETVRKFGVIINEAALNQELLNMGITDGTKAATEAQKANARLTLIIAGTADAQDDATRTSRSFANVMKSLRASMKDVSEEIGMILIPWVSKLIEKVKGILQWWKDLDYTQKKLIITIAAIVAGIGPLLFIVGKLMGSVKLLSAIFSLIAAHPIVAAISAIIAVFVLLLTKCEWFREFWKGFWEGVVGIAEDFVNGVIFVINQFINGINLLISAINLIPGVEIPGLGAIGYVDFSGAIAGASKTVADSIEEIGVEITDGLADYGTIQANELAGIADAVGEVAESVSLTLDERLTDLGTAITEGTAITAHATEESLGDIAQAIEDLEERRGTVETWVRELNEIQAELDAGFPAVEAAMDRAAAEFGEAKVAYDRATAELEVAIRDGTVIDLETLQWAQMDAKERLDLARDQYALAIADSDAFEASALAREQRAAEIREELGKIGVTEEKIRVAQEEAVKRLWSIDVGIPKLGATLTFGFEDIVDAFTLEMGDMSVIYKDGVLDLELKIGENTIKITEAIALLQTLMGGQLGALLASIAGLAGAILGALAPLIALAVFVAGFVKIIEWIKNTFFGGSRGEVTRVPSLQLGGIVPGPIGRPMLVMAHGGEPFGAAGVSQLLDYGRIEGAVYTGIFDAMLEVMSRQEGRPVIVQLPDKTVLARALFMPLLEEQQRRGTVLL